MSKKRQAESDDVVFYGEETCELGRVVPCTNKAYFRLLSGKLSCGVHAQHKPRRDLPKNPDADRIVADRYAEWDRLVEAAAAMNFAAGYRGALTVCKMRMMKPPPHTDGVRNIYPNNRAGDKKRKDGHGFCALSPMRLGPTAHWQPDLPQALSIENYHQFNKVFAREVEPDPADATKPRVKPSFFEAQRAAYLDAEPHRRKFADEKGTDGNRNAPLFCLHLTATGEARRYTYLESRYFYCREYERLASQTAALAKLRSWLAAGYNLQIAGYDGYPVTKSLYEHYVDPAAPFGHELALYTLLSVERAENYPWNVYFRAHRERYE